MVHLEGGWPKNVNASDVGSKTQYQKKIEKIENYLRTLKVLTEPMIHVLDQNIALDMYDEYFPPKKKAEIIESDQQQSKPTTAPPPQTSPYDDMNWAYGKPQATILTVFKDPCSSIQTRTASSISWFPNDYKKLAVAYCVPQKPDIHMDVVNSYIWDIHNPNQPDMELSPTSPLCSIAYNPKDSSCLVGGAVNGTIFLFDTRRGSFSVDNSHMQHSNRDPVYEVKWVQSKQNNECVSVSTDGLILVWDVRNLGEPIERYSLKQKESGGTPSSMNTSSVLGAISMEYETSYSTSKFLIGTEQGVIVSWNRKSKKKTERMYFGHHGSVYSVQRNPFLPKYFLSVGDWTARVWHDDLWKQPIMETKYHDSYLTAGCWSPIKPGIFFTTKMDGTMDVWDYCHNQSKPVVSLTLSETGLYSIKASVGKYVAVGAADGSVSFLELSEDLSEKSSSDEKKIFSDMLERVARQDKILESGNASKNRMDSVVDVSKLDDMLKQLQESTSKDNELNQNNNSNNQNNASKYHLTDQQLLEIEQEYQKDVQLSKDEFNQRSPETTSVEQKSSDVIENGDGELATS
jgi:dynein intermediate chain 2